MKIVCRKFFDHKFICQMYKSQRGFAIPPLLIAALAVAIIPIIATLAANPHEKVSVQSRAQSSGPTCAKIAAFGVPGGVRVTCTGSLPATVDNHFRYNRGFGTTWSTPVGVQATKGTSTYTYSPLPSSGQYEFQCRSCSDTTCSAWGGVNGVCTTSLYISPTPLPNTPYPKITPTPVIGSAVGVIPSADSFVNSSSAGTNYGEKPILEVDGSPVKISYFKYNLGISQLIGKTITSAKLRLRITNTSTSMQQVKLVTTNTWNENTISFNNRPSLGATVATNYGGTSGTTLDITLPVSLIQQRLGQLVSLAIVSSGSDDLHFYSRNFTSNTSYRPKLVIGF